MTNFSTDTYSLFFAQLCILTLRSQCSGDIEEERLEKSWEPEVVDDWSETMSLGLAGPLNWCTTVGCTDLHKNKPLKVSAWMGESWEPASLTEEVLTNDSIEAGRVRFCVCCLFLMVWPLVGQPQSTGLFHTHVYIICQGKLDYVDYCSFLKKGHEIKK